MKGISVIVCCYNSADRLPETLKHLQQQKTCSAFCWELIIVDNCSTDKTVEVAEKCWNNPGNQIPLQLIAEQKQGLSFARQKGISAAQYDTIIFCDDDNWLDENYLSYAFQRMEQDPTIGVLGGQSSAFFETRKPEWFDIFQNAYAVGKPLKASGNADARTYIAGAGMVTRKSIFATLQQCSFQQSNTDRTKNSLLSGGDAEFCFAVLYLGYHLHYDERLQFTHYLSAPRLEWSYCKKMLTIGHALPQLNLYFYHYCHCCFNRNKTATFPEAYLLLRKKTWRNVWYAFVALKPFWVKAVILFHSREGQKNDIAFKAQLNKSAYIFLHKKKLHTAFMKIEGFIHALNARKKQAKNAINV